MQEQPRQNWRQQSPHAFDTQREAGHQRMVGNRTGNQKHNQKHNKKDNQKHISTNTSTNISTNTNTRKSTTPTKQRNKRSSERSSKGSSMGSSKGSSQEVGGEGPSDDHSGTYSLSSKRSQRSQHAELNRHDQGNRPSMDTRTTVSSKPIMTVGQVRREFLRQVPEEVLDQVPYEAWDHIFGELDSLASRRSDDNGEDDRLLTSKMLRKLGSRMEQEFHGEVYLEDCYSVISEISSYSAIAGDNVAKGARAMRRKILLTSGDNFAPHTQRQPQSQPQSQSQSSQGGQRSKTMQQHATSRSSNRYIPRDRKTTGGGLWGDSDEHIDFDDDSYHKHNALNTSSTSTTNSSTETETERSVVFGQVHLRIYERTLSYNPSVSIGPAIGLSWEYVPFNHGIISVDDFEMVRSRERVTSPRHLVVSRKERIVLLRSLGVSQMQIADNTRRIRRDQKKRVQTIQNIRVDEMAYAARRTVKRFLGLSRGSDKHRADGKAGQ